jgi:hypothetical protein
MGDRNKKTNRSSYGLVIALLLILSVGVLYFFYVEYPTEIMDKAPDNISLGEEVLKADNPNAIVEGIHVRTGLMEAEGLMTVVNNCTTCHSAQLVTQNRMGKAQWEATIRWMQKEQGLWELGDNEEIIINYLTTNYPVLKKGRRQALTAIDWYNLEE